MIFHTILSSKYLILSSKYKLFLHIISAILKFVYEIYHMEVDILKKTEKNPLQHIFSFDVSPYTSIKEFEPGDIITNEGEKTLYT